ncbi:MAG: YitT family protein, partial [Aristaeellaceae bacterium]
ATTVLSSFLYPAALEVFGRLLEDVVLTRDLMLNTVFYGMGVGLSLGMVIRAGASTGGMDIPPLVLNRLLHIPVSVSLNVFDILILLMQAVYLPAERLLYGIVLVMVYTLVLDKVMLLGTSRTEIKVVSKKAEEIRAAILQQMDRGVTMLDGEGGYARQPLQMILSVVSNRELPRLEQIIHGIDPESFMVVSRVSEVRGRGFTLSKTYPN